MFVSCRVPFLFKLSSSTKNMYALNNLLIDILCFYINFKDIFINQIMEKHRKIDNNLISKSYYDKIKFPCN